MTAVTRVVRPLITLRAIRHHVTRPSFLFFVRERAPSGALESITSHGQPPPPRSVVEVCGRLPLGFPRSALVVRIGLHLKETNSNMPWPSALRRDALQIVTTKGPSTSSITLTTTTTFSRADHHNKDNYNNNSW